MFGISFSEMLIIAIVAVIALGPDKLPKAMVEIAKFMKLFKKTVNDARSSFEQELKIAELKEDAKKYKENIEKAKSDIRKKITFDELEEIKSGINETTNDLTSSLGDIKKGIETIKNPTNAIKEEIKDKILNKDTTIEDKENRGLDNV